MAKAGFDEDGLMDITASPRLQLKIEDGQLWFRVVHWSQRPGAEDVHFEGSSRWAYGEWRLCLAFELEGDYPELVLDQLIEMLPEELRR